MVFFNGLKQKRAVAPCFLTFTWAIVLVLQDNRQLWPELLGHLGVEPRARWRLNADAVVPECYAFGQGIIGDREVPSRLARSGKVVTDCQQGLFKMFAVQIHVDFPRLKIKGQFGAGPCVTFTPNAE